MLTAEELNKQGNDSFKAEDYKSAERLYGEAIVKNANVPKYFSNRAETRLRLADYPGAVDDAERSVELDRGWMRGWHRLIKAYIALHRPHKAVEAALSAYDLCIKDPKGYNKDALETCKLVLAAKKARWEARERDRIQGRNLLLDECITAVREGRKRREEELASEHSEGRISQRTVNEETEVARKEELEKERELRKIFAATSADPSLEFRGEPPPYFLDAISLEFMHDPVVTTYGQSYERAHILRHIAVKPTDPLTGEPLYERDLRRNLYLKDACADYLDNNGWAADY